MTDAHSSPQASRSVGGRASNGLLRYFVEHRTAANLLLALMLMAGVAAGLQIRSQFFPDVVIESITVRVPWDGAGPEDVDRSIVAALEPRLLAVDGVESMRAQAQEGRASITLEFEPGWDMSVAIDEVKTAVDETTTLPDEADDPRITLGRFRDLVTNIVLAGPRTPDQLDLYAQELKSRLFQAGVSRVTVQGVRDPQIRVEPSEASLERYGLTLREIADRVAAEVEARPAGELDNGAGRVRAGEERKSVDRLGAVSVRTLPDGSRLLLRDVAVIRERGAESGVAFFRDGQPAVQLRVERDAEGDSIGIQRTVEQVVETYRPALPADVETVLTRTRSQAILDRLDILWRNGLTGLGIVLVLLFLFLSARTAFWVSAGIPAAMMATIAFMWAFGLSLNMVSLFALIICLGIVVDDAIVVGEHADRLARDGLPPADAASVAATRMAAPVFSASVTTVIAFLALVVIGGRFGELIADLPRTVALVILASLVECFVILPAHMRHALAAQARGAAAGARARTVAWWDRPSLYVNRWFETVREQGLRPLMRWATRQRYPVLAGALALLAFTLAMRFDNTVRWRFWSAPERGVVQANVMMLSGATREDTFAMLEEMRRALEETDRALAAEHGRAPVTDAIAKLGATSGRGLSGEDTRDPDQLGSLSIELIDPDFRPYSQGDFVRLWRSRIEEHPLLETLAVRGERSGPGGDAIEIELTGGADARTLKAAAEALKARLAALPGVSALEDSLPYDAAELVLTLTPKGEALGFTTQTLGAELRARLAGITAAQFPRGAREAEIQVALPEQTLDAAFLYRTRVPIPSAGGATIALTEVAEIERRPSFGVIQRLDGRRIVTVNGDVVEDAETAGAVQTALRERILPEIETLYGVETAEGGLAKQEREFLSEAAIALWACLFGIYVTLAWVFASWLRPLAVMMAIPFALIGAIWGHWVHGLPMSIFSIVGLIGMAGIVINDSIVLITTIDERAKRQAMAEAVVDGVCDRFRAVLLTTLTTVGGLAPLLFEQSRQALFLKPTVVTLAYGLGFGLILVLLVTPALVMLQHDVGLRLKSFRRSLSLARRRRKGLGTAARAPQA